MRRLLWKELREKRVWLLALIGSTSGLILLHDPYVFLGDVQSPWLMLSVLAAFGLGASAYSTELAGGAADFIMSRPIAWKRMLFAKLVVGLVLVMVAAILATVVFRLTCPEQYVRFVGPPQLARGFAIALLLSGAGYVAGFACSTVLPGAAGGMLVAVGVFLSCALEVYLWDRLHAAPSAQWSIYLRVLGAALATVLIARFGLTLPPSRRLIRYASIVGVFAIVGLPLNYCLKTDPFAGSGRSAVWDLSPNGHYAALEQTINVSGSTQAHYASFLVRVSDGKRAETFWRRGTVYHYTVCWHGDTLAAISADLEHATSAPTYLWMGRMDDSGRLRSARFLIPHSDQSFAEIVPSPSGRRVMVAAGVRDGTNGLTFADLDTLRVIAPAVESGVQDYWWQFETEVGYTDKDGTRQVARVVD